MCLPTARDFNGYPEIQQNIKYMEKITIYVYGTLFLTTALIITFNEIHNFFS